MNSLLAAGVVYDCRLSLMIGPVVARQRRCCGNSPRRRRHCGLGIETWEASGNVLARQQGGMMLGQLLLRQAVQQPLGLVGWLLPTAHRLGVGHKRSGTST